MRRTLAAVAAGFAALSLAAAGAAAPPVPIFPQPVGVAYQTAYDAALKYDQSPTLSLSFSPSGPLTVTAGQTVSVRFSTAADVDVVCSRASTHALLDGAAVEGAAPANPNWVSGHGLYGPQPTPGPTVHVAGGGTHTVVFTIPYATATEGISTYLDSGGNPTDYIGPWVSVIGTGNAAGRESLLPFQIVGSYRIRFLNRPKNTSAEAVMNVALKVAVENEKGDVLTSDDRSVIRVEIVRAGFPYFGMHGTLAAQVVNGVATFADLSFDYPGDFYLLASSEGFKAAVEGSSIGVADVVGSGTSSQPFKIGASKWKLRFVQQPASAAAGHALAPSVTVEILDDKGAVAATDDSYVTLSLSGGSGATLGGTLSVAAVNGVATFTDLKVDKDGMYKLVATNRALKPVKSKKFKISG